MVQNILATNQNESAIDKQLLEDLLAYRNILADDIVKENSISEDDVEFMLLKKF